MVGVEQLDLNTRVGSSLLRNVRQEWQFFLMALSTNEEGVEGYKQPPHKIQPLHTFEQSRWDRSGQLGETESSNNVNVGIFGGTENTISVSPIRAKTRACQFRWDRLHHLGDTDLMTEGYRNLATHVSVRPSSESENPSLLGFGLWLRWFISV